MSLGVRGWGSKEADKGRTKRPSATKTAQTVLFCTLRLCYFARVVRSPITWDNVILYGEYVLDRDLIRL